MPTEEKQLKAMHVLRERLLKRIESDACSEFEEDILNRVINTIDTELLATERQQLIWAIQEAYGHGRDESNEPHTFEQIQESVELILSKFKTQ